jgi:tetratricopeptide (TPR) repeat protein
MSEKRRNCLSLAIAIACFQSVASQASFAVDPEVLGKKMMIHKCLKDIYVAQRRELDAIGEFKALLALDPNDAQTHFEYANFLAQSQKLPQAAVEYQAAARLKPGVAQYQGGLGNGFMYTKRYAMAVAAYTRAIQLGGKFQQQLQIAEQYEAQEKQLKVYEKKIEQKKEEEEE